MERKVKEDSQENAAHAHDRPGTGPAEYRFYETLL
jgi:hypothetical protein